MTVFNGYDFGTDGANYDLIKGAVQDIVKNNVPGILGEIGTREGGSLAWILNSLQELGAYHYNVICIDPWGNIDYQTNEATNCKPGYTNPMKKEFLKKLYAALENIPLDVKVFQMEDTEFMERYKDYVPFYDQAKIKESKYAFMYIDGPHHLKAVLEETQFFAERMSIGGYILYDNVGYYPHDQVHSYLLSSGFTEIDFAGEKRLYKHEGISTKKVA